MEPRPLGCKHRNCHNELKRSLLNHRGRTLHCNNCLDRILAPPYSCAEHDYDLCTICARGATPSYSTRSVGRGQRAVDEA
eukprot:5481543-Prymnesium_polylepis.1